MSVKLPLLGAKSAPLAHAEHGELGQRTLADRPLLCVLGTEGVDLHARFACTLARELARAGGPPVVLTSRQASVAVEQALCDAGARVERMQAAVSRDALASALQRVAPAPCLLIEHEAAAQLQGWLEVWVGPAPLPASDARALALFRACELWVSPSSLGVAVPLAAGLAQRMRE